MTAEAAVLNKSAVALAADSAVTVGNDGQEKIFNTANKIFTLSHQHPIGDVLWQRRDNGRAHRDNRQAFSANG